MRGLQSRSRLENAPSTHVASATSSSSRFASTRPRRDVAAPERGSDHRTSKASQHLRAVSGEQLEVQPTAQVQRAGKRRDIRINLAITGAQTLEVLLGVIFRHGHEFSAINTSTALGRLTKHVSSSRRDTRLRIETAPVMRKGLAFCPVAPLATHQDGSHAKRPELLAKWPLSREGEAAVKAALDVLLGNAWFQVLHLSAADHTDYCVFVNTTITQESATLEYTALAVIRLALSMLNAVQV
jgi:hypothetical protein